MGIREAAMQSIVFSTAVRVYARVSVRAKSEKLLDEK